MSGNLIQSKTLQDGTATYHTSDFRYLYVPPQNTFGASIALSSSLVPVTFNLPVDVYNLYHAKMPGTINLPATNTANRYIWMFENNYSGSIGRIEFFVDTGHPIVFVDYLQNYMNLILPKETSFKDFITYDNPNYTMNNAGNNYITQGQVNTLYPSNSAKTVVPALRYCGTQANIPNTSSTNYVEQAYFSVAPLNQPRTINFMLDLGKIKNTYFSMDTLSYWNRISYIRVNFGPLNKICYMSDSPLDPNAGTIASYDGVGPTITNLQLLLPIEMNEHNREMAIKKLTSGYSRYIPFVTCKPNTSIANTIQSLQIPFNQNEGKTLMKVIHGVFNINQLNNAYDHSNNFYGPNNTQKILSFNTTLNGKKEQDITIDCGNAGTFLDYTHMKSQLLGSVIQNLDQYQYNWYWCSDYTKIPLEMQQEDNKELFGGIPLGTVDLVWGFYGAQMAPTSFNHFTYAVFSKILSANGSKTEVS